MSAAPHLKLDFGTKPNVLSPAKTTVLGHHTIRRHDLGGHSGRSVSVPFEPSKVDAAARTFCRYRWKADIRCRRTKAGSAGQTRYPSCFTLGWRRAASFNDSQADKSRNHKMQPWMPSHRGHKVMLCKNLTSPLSVPSADGASNEALA